MVLYDQFLKTQGLTVKLFTDALEQHVFLCENCDIWHDPYVRVHNEIAEMTVCEECDEIIFW